MKHIFIINPAAGKDNSFENIKKILELKKVEVDYELYETQAPGDATAYIRKYCTEHKEPVRFYACGGDGTTAVIFYDMSDGKYYASNLRMKATPFVLTRLEGILGKENVVAK